MSSRLHVSSACGSCGCCPGCVESTETYGIETYGVLKTSRAACRTVGDEHTASRTHCSSEPPMRSSFALLMSWPPPACARARSAARSDGSRRVDGVSTKPCRRICDASWLRTADLSPEEARASPTTAPAALLAPRRRCWRESSSAWPMRATESSWRARFIDVRVALPTCGQWFRLLASR